MYGYIYLTTNLINNKIYVGQHKAVTFDTSYYGSGKLITRVIEKYGIKNFKCEMLKECFSQEELDKEEKQYISQLNCKNPKIGYNLADGGSEWAYHLGMLGKHQTETQKESTRKACSYKRSEEIRKKMSESAKQRTSNRVTHTGYVWVSNGTEEYLIHPSKVEHYVNKGFKLNKRLSRPDNYINDIKDKYSNGCYVNKDGKDEFIDNSELDSYLQNGYSLGRKNCYTEKRGSNISASKKGCICVNNGVKNFYINPLKLDEYLSNGYVKERLKY